MSSPSYTSYTKHKSMQSFLIWAELAQHEEETPLLLPLPGYNHGISNMTLYNEHSHGPLLRGLPHIHTLLAASCVAQLLGAAAAVQGLITSRQLYLCVYLRKSQTTLCSLLLKCTRSTVHWSSKPVFVFHTYCIQKIAFMTNYLNEQVIYFNYSDAFSYANVNSL